ncbi:MAG: DAK2 domain-containing protein [Anaerolineales bacterium]|nr:DAK2 domain-containing protein [Anaerolineales bacterium]
MTTPDTSPAPRPAQELYAVSGLEFKQLTEAAIAWLTTNREIINALNVFPIPDGDTGTNMLMTMQAAYREVAGRADKNVGAIAHAIAHGALMGARGNSGVILSQIWRGFARALDSQESFDAPLFARALKEASETAYRGSVRPVEGTILTVIKDSALAAEDAVQRHREFRAVLERVVHAAQASVARTPELLPVLKQAGVVDSGGKGLTVLLEGMLRYLRGQPLDQPMDTVVRPLHLDAVGAALEAAEPGQEWEVVVDFRPRAAVDLPAFYQQLEALGTAIQVGEGDGLYRVHIHLLKSRRHEPLELVETFGTITNVHMENLLAQVEELQAVEVPPLPLTPVAPGHLGLVAVAPGDGLARILASLGASAIVDGGQSQNPSTEEILTAISDLPTDQVVILPNNKNIILAAQQAAQLSPKQVAVVPSRSVPQGIAAMMQFAPSGSLADVSAAMERSLSTVQTGEVTVATRTVELNGVAVNEGQVIGLLNGQIAVAENDLSATVLRLLERMAASEPEVIGLYYGQDVTEAAAEQVAEAIRERFPDLSVELHDGGQPHYRFIISAE